VSTLSIATLGFLGSEESACTGTVILAKSNTRNIVVSSRKVSLTKKAFPSAQVVEIKNTSSVTNFNDEVTLTSQNDSVRVCSPGIQGPRGQAGQGVGLPPINFSYGDATPKLLYTALAACVIDLSQIIIRNAFNGVGASLSIGTAGDNSAVMSVSTNDPAMVQTFEASPDLIMAIGDALYLYITPGAGATVGNGQVLLSPLNL